MPNRTDDIRRRMALGVVLALALTACTSDATSPETRVAPRVKTEPTPTTQAAEAAVASVASFRCDPTEVRAHRMPEHVSAPSISLEEALVAPELSPGRMLYLIDAGVNEAVARFDATEAEVAAIITRLERDEQIPEAKEAARAAAGPQWGGMWLSDVAVVIATFGDPSAVEEAVADFGFRIDVLPVSYRLRDLKDWRDAVNEQLDPVAGTPAATVVQTSNAVRVKVEHDAAPDFTGIPCDALDLELLPPPVAHVPDTAQPPPTGLTLEARPQAQTTRGNIDYGPRSSPCATVEVWSAGEWRKTGLAAKTAAWHSEATDTGACAPVLSLGFTTLTIPDGTLPGWYRICLDVGECALVEVVAG